MSMRFVGWLATGLILGTASAVIWAKAPFNDSGMLMCMDTAGRLSLSCAESAQDAASGRDLDTPGAKDGRAGFSFQRVCNNGAAAGEPGCPAKPVQGALRNQWGCTLDRVSGLLWELKTSDGGARDYRNRYTNHGDKRQGDASRYPDSVNGAKLCGRSNWRLPTPVEVLGIVDMGVPAPGPMIDTAWFPATESGAFWTSAPYPPVPEEGRAVSFHQGSTNLAMRWFALNVRVVSGASRDGAAGRYVANGGEVTDRLTGLVWRRCSEGQLWNGTTCSGSLAEFYGWHTAIEHAKAVAASAGVQWRVPNIKELASLVDTSRWSPAINTVYFPGTTSSTSYWSSTPDGTPADEGFSATARTVDFNTGEANGAGFDDAVNPRWLRLVRSAP